MHISNDFGAVNGSFSRVGKAVGSVASRIQRLVDWLNGLDEGTKKIIVTIPLVAAAVAQGLIIIGKVVGAIGTIMTVVPQIAAAISDVIAFVSGTVIPAIGAMEGAVYAAGVVRIGCWRGCGRDIL